MNQQPIQKVEIKEYNAKETIVIEGTSNDRFYVVLQGSVEVLHENKSIRVIAEGDVFGIEYYYLRCPYAMTAQALTDARVASYHTDMLNDIIYDNPQLTQRLFTSLARQLDDTSKIIARNQPVQKETPNLEGLDIEEADTNPLAEVAEEAGSKLEKLLMENLRFEEVRMDRTSVESKTFEPPAPEPPSPVSDETQVLGTMRFDQTQAFDADEVDATRDTPQAAEAPPESAGPLDFHDQLLSCFIEESSALLKELQILGESLKLVGIPNDDEARQLIEFAQKLNRLIGGTASMGFDQFSQLSRKTSLLAARCAEIREMTIRILVSNLNLVISVLEECFSNVEAIKKVDEMIPQLEQRLDICMVAVGIEHPDIKSQNEIDDILEKFRRGEEV